MAYNTSATLDTADKRTNSTAYNRCQGSRWKAFCRVIFGLVEEQFSSRLTQWLGHPGDYIFCSDNISSVSLCTYPLAVHLSGKYNSLEETIPAIRYVPTPILLLRLRKTGLVQQMRRLQRKTKKRTGHNGCRYCMHTKDSTERTNEVFIGYCVFIQLPPVCAVVLVELRLCLQDFPQGNMHRTALYMC